MTAPGLNLLPEDQQRRAIRFQVIVRWCPVLLGITLAVTLLTWHLWMRFDDLADQVRVDRPVAAEVGRALEQVRRADIRMESLEHQLHELQQLRPSPDPMALMAAVSRAAELADDRLVLSSLSVTNATQTRIAADAAPAARAAGGATAGQADDVPESDELLTRLELNGSAVSDLAVARFVSGLRDGTVFDEVRLVSSLPTRSESPLQREFIVHCTRTEALP